MTLQKTLNLHNLTDHVAVVKAVMCVNISALAVGSMAGYLETNTERSAAAAEYSSRFSSSVLSRALKEL